ncbi:hypothetical protein [Streptomonospora wellingtoniae]|uniref:DUF3592 domain-containing protein n=1 Tax=Streptomonospora wellingtoniae TaxID=3075544 RepID=A0ABU2KT62_9ACTN|nr:hypothetical protein [Streptomonospora sp. DSM 45055]MDT0302477.1 hypothetical protein [Streptomonospora sp. DSM 45055]
MDPVLPMAVVAIIAVLGIAVLAFVLPRMLHKRKGAQWSDWARENGWDYAEIRPDMIGNLSTVLNPQHYKVQHVLSRTHRGRWVFTYEHLQTVRPGSRDNNTTRYRRVVAVTLPAPAPKLDIGVETGSMSCRT